MSRHDTVNSIAWKELSTRELLRELINRQDSACKRAPANPFYDVLDCEILETLDERAQSVQPAVVFPDDVELLKRASQVPYLLQNYRSLSDDLDDVACELDDLRTKDSE